MKVLFTEPPKDLWFVMGEYLPPPLGILELASYLENSNENVEIKVLDCQAESLDWKGLEGQLESFNPDIVAPSSLSSCNTYTVIRTLETAKMVDPNVTTVVGGQHFTATAQESLETYDSIDVVVRGEGEETFAEIVKTKERKQSLSNIRGISFRHKREVLHTPKRPLIENLDDLPFPGYHFVEKHMKKYHFQMMAGNTGYALIEASRGCPHHCTFCSQWGFWGGRYRAKSPTRVADEMAYCNREFGSKFLWLTDDNFGLDQRTGSLCNELINRGLADDIMWFMQARSDDICRNQDILSKMRRAGNLWILTGLESGHQETLEAYQKGIDPAHAKEAIDLLKKHDIFSQATLIIGERRDSHESIQKLRDFINKVDPDLAIFMILTPFPGTELHETAKREGWIEETNWSNFDMLHAIMPTIYLSRQEVQEELYECYRSFYGSIKRRVMGLFSSNSLKRKTYKYLASQGLLKALQDLF